MKRVVYFDFLKVISMFTVVLIHVLSELFYIYEVNSFEYRLVVFIDSICRFSVPVFYMVSGALFLNQDKDISIKKIFKKYIPNILIIFLFWNTFYSVTASVILNNKILSFSLVKDAFINSLLGHRVYQFDFLVTIIGFYLCVPVLRLITKKGNKKQIEYLLIISLIYTGIFNFLPSLFNIEIR